MQEADSPSHLPASGAGRWQWGKEPGLAAWEPKCTRWLLHRCLSPASTASCGLPQVVHWKPWPCVLIKCTWACLEIGHPPQTRLNIQEKYCKTKMSIVLLMFIAVSTVWVYSKLAILGKFWGVGFVLLFCSFFLFVCFGFLFFCGSLKARQLPAESPVAFSLWDGIWFWRGFCLLL